MNDDVIEALESSAPNTDKHRIDPRANSSKRDVLNWRDVVMRFLDDIDGDLTVFEVRTALEDYE